MIFRRNSNIEIIHSLRKISRYFSDGLICHLPIQREQYLDVLGLLYEAGSRLKINPHVQFYRIAELVDLVQVCKPEWNEGLPDEIRQIADESLLACN